TSPLPQLEWRRNPTRRALGARKRYRPRPVAATCRATPAQGILQPFSLPSPLFRGWWRTPAAAAPCPPPTMRRWAVCRGKPMSHSDVFIVGAGPAGLTAAYLLTKQGISTTVIEADPTYVGGISRTASYKNFLFDIGGHRFFSKSKEVVDLWKEILPDDFIERPRLSRIYYNGSFFSYPLKAFEALNNLGYVQSALCVLSYLHKQAFPTANPESFHDWVANQFGEL